MIKKEDFLNTTGTITEVLGSGLFRVKCKNEVIIMARISSKFRHSKKKLNIGSFVKLRLNINDLGQGKII